ncbi:protein-S-isoprenylcysteine O-methyltransferase Ste14 [Arthrobacter sp. W4I7]|nr:protein-S-isoprenylcysteine O-methyltransferase Ste14 [Arthrobacter sp. W4I7]
METVIRTVGLHKQSGGTTAAWSGAWWMLAIAGVAAAVAMTAMQRRETALP